MMQYISTRGSMPPKTFSQALIEGLAPDGGLITAHTYPSITQAELAQMKGLTYPALALSLISQFADDIPVDELKTCIDSVYNEAIFGTAEITPVSPLQTGLYLLHLSNGPTFAFKDIAMQFLGSLFEYLLAKNARSISIVGATSGDTGSAAEYAMKGKAHIQIFMLAPHGKMSAFQRAQMLSLMEPNIHNIAIEGSFDRCQAIVKAINEDPEFKKNYQIGVINSINWGRIIAQVVYYFYAYLQVAQQTDVPVNFVVPSGNFGNVYAGHVAKAMGLPIHKLIVATNENDVLYEFIQTGYYRPRNEKAIHITSSPSMDIGRASNIERFVFDLVDRNQQRFNDLWQTLTQNGEIDLRNTVEFTKMSSQYGFFASKSTHKDRLTSIRKVYDQHHLIIDPHTANGYQAALAHLDAKIPTILLETASAIKFADTIQEAIGFRPTRPTYLSDLEKRPQKFTILPADLGQVKSYIRNKLKYPC